MPRTTAGSAANSAAARRSTKRPRALPFELRRSPIQGTGAFAVRLIRKGQRIIEYAGERISSEEADRRYDESRMRRHHTFLFTVDRKTVVDGARDGNEARFINHSCDPNCEAIIEDGRIWIYALRTIRPGEELVYDYQYQRSGDPDEDAEREKFYRCRCGAPTCRGTILLPPRKPRPKTAAKAAAKRGGAKRGGKTAPKSRTKTAAKAAAKRGGAKRGGKTAPKSRTKTATKSRAKAARKSRAKTAAKSRKR